VLVDTGSDALLAFRSEDEESFEIHDHCAKGFRVSDPAALGRVLERLGVPELTVSRLEDGQALVTPAVVGLWLVDLAARRTK
jgi:hypothetical protein